MATDFDATEFVDTDFQAHKSPDKSTVTALAGALQRAPTREEVDSKVAEAQQKLGELKRAQEDLERERSALEELRRRQLEFQNGRQEMVQSLTRGVGLLQEAEFTARRDAEQMAKSLADLRAALVKVEAIHEETWNKDNFNTELTRALTAIENARMEWNSARLKHPVLSGASATEVASDKPAAVAASPFSEKSFGQLCKLGLALTWPLAAVALVALGVLVALLMSR
jgi:chromosome segregation ATPase